MTVQNLTPGANAPLSNQAATAVEVVWGPEKIGGADVDVSAFILGEDGKVLGDDYFIFYNQPRSPEGAVQLTAAGARVNTTINLAQLPPQVVKIAFAITIHGQSQFSSAQSLSIAVDGQLRFEPSFQPMTESALILGEIYKRNGQWKFRTVGQGFVGGLGPLATHFGVDIGEPEPAPAPPAPAPPAPAPAPPAPAFAPAPPAPAPPAPAPAPVALPAPAPAPAPSTRPNLTKVSGKVSLAKGQKSVIIEKTPNLVAEVSWRSGTDYDIYALVMTQSGEEIAVATFGAKEPKASGLGGLFSSQKTVPPMMNYNNCVVHRGDIVGTSSALSSEIVDIRPSPDILAIVPVAYSAQSNGTGSFFRYKVALRIDNCQGTEITIDSTNANQNDKIYTCIPGIIYNRPDGLEIEAVELYSQPGSERRPRLTLQPDGRVAIAMDAGPVNDFK